MRGFLVVCLVLSACQSSSGGMVFMPGNVASPGQQYALGSSFSDALQCPASALTWTIVENAPPNPPNAGGSLDAAGNFTAPACGSPFVGSTVHITATGCNRSATVAVAVVEDLQSVTLAAAIVTTTPPGTIPPVTCLAVDPANPAVEAGRTIQFYARLSFSCHDAVTPTLPDTMPPPCP